MLCTDRLGPTARWLPVGVASAVGLVLATAGWAGAATRLTVCPADCDYTQVGDAIAAVDSGGTILLRAGTYTGGLVIDKSLTLQGAGASQTVIRSGMPAVEVDPGVQVTVQRLAVVGDSEGIANHGRLTLLSSAVKTTLNGYDGGAGILNTGVLRVRGSAISGSPASGIVTNGGDVTIAGSTIGDNASGDELSGGGLYNLGGSVTVSDSTITHNHTGVGGGIWTAGTLVVRASTISGNSALYCGGGIATSGSTTIRDTVITGNSAGVFGGAGIAHLGGELLLSDSTVTGNSGRGPDIADLSFC